MKNGTRFVRNSFVLLLFVGLMLPIYANAQTENDTKFIAPQPSSFIVPEQSNEPQTKMKVDKRPLLQRYYDHSGRSMVSILSFGYSTYFNLSDPAGNPTYSFGRRHILNCEIFELRVRLFGISPFNFEMGINTPHAYPGDVLSLFQRGGTEKTDVVKADGNTMWFAYKPTIKAYIPVAKWCAIEVIGGVSADITKVWNKISINYYKNHPEVPEQNFFLTVNGGVGFVFTPSPATPIEIKAEYRHPLMGNIALVPQGIYLSAQIHLGSPIHKNDSNRQTN